MIVERIWTGNAYRNYNYLIACPETGEALAIDPLDHGKCLAAAKHNGWRITQILNTHEHHDHTGGNAAVVEATGAKVIAHHRAGGRIAGMDRGVKAGDVIKVGKTVELECLDTPGHTMCHICLRSHTEQPALFSGDTLFNAGAGNCHNGGDPGAMYDTFARQLDTLPDDTQVYPGHDYIENNLKFTLARESGNEAARSLLHEVSGQDPAAALVTTMAEEKRINTFLRLASPGVIAGLREAFPDLPEQPDAKTVFVKLRELRNTWCARRGAPRRPLRCVSVSASVSLRQCQVRQCLGDDTAGVSVCITQCQPWPSRIQVDESSMSCVVACWSGRLAASRGATVWRTR
jgi:hydroxyacylglutathione hydrolase